MIRVFFRFFSSFFLVTIKSEKEAKRGKMVVIGTSPLTIIITTTTTDREKKHIHTEKTEDIRKLIAVKKDKMWKRPSLENPNLAIF